jgi:hypothetical protein
MLINIILGIAFMYLNDWGIDVVTRSIHDNTESVKEMFEVRSVGYEFDRIQFKGCSAYIGMVSNEKI